jgi:hypothetical protein
VAFLGLPRVSYGFKPFHRGMKKYFSLCAALRGKLQQSCATSFHPCRKKRFRRRAAKTSLRARDALTLVLEPLFVIDF